MKKTLVAYFSCTRITEKLALRLAAQIGAETFEILAATQYTPADLNWRNPQSRTSIEMKDSTSRPDLEFKLLSLASYDVIFIGFPIWWYRHPSIIDSFLESVDFTGKTIVPFATSGSSGMGDTSRLIKGIVPKANVLEGQRFSRHASDAELKQWAEGFLL